MKEAAPRETRAMVRIPAGRSDWERSKPIREPVQEAKQRRKASSSSAMEGKKWKLPRTLGVSRTVDAAVVEAVPAAAILAVAVRGSVGRRAVAVEARP